MEEFIHRESLIIFKRRLAAVKNEAQRQMLLKLLAEEEAKDTRAPPRGGMMSLDVPRGTMDEVSSYVRLDLAARLTARPR